MADSIEELKAKILSLEKANTYLGNKVSSYEGGDQSLYYAVQRKMKELSKILNKHDLDAIDIDDKNNKSFERLSAILEKCEKYALSANALGARLGIGASDTNNSGEAIVRKITTPESMAQEHGDYKTQNV
jgi:hypothetical protein